MQHNAALEAAIASDPYDPGAYLVLADWLQALDEPDPRGELIALQVASEAADPWDRPRLRAAIEAMFVQHTDHLLGSFAPYARDFDEPPLIWRFGFLHRVELRSLPQAAEILRRVLAHDSGRFVTELVLAGSDRRELRTAIDHVVKAALPTLRSLAIESSLDLGPLDTLWPATRQLRYLAIDTHAFETRAFDLPMLESATFDGELPAATLRAIAGGRWPRLKHLGITFTGGSASLASRSDPRDPSFDDLAPLFERDLPALRFLGIRGSPFGAAICRRLPHARFARQLVDLDLTGNDIVDADAFALAANPARFDPRLTLTIPTTRLTAAGSAALRVLDPKVRRADTSDPTPR